MKHDVRQRGSKEEAKKKKKDKVRKRCDKVGCSKVRHWISTASLLRYLIFSCLVRTSDKSFPQGSM